MDALLNTRKRTKAIAKDKEVLNMEIVPSFLSVDSYLYFWRKGKIVERQRVVELNRQRGIVTLSSVHEYLTQPLPYPEFDGFCEVRLPVYLEVTHGNPDAQ